MPCGMHNACQLSIHHGAYIGPTVEGSMSLLVHPVTRAVKLLAIGTQHSGTTQCDPVPDSTVLRAVPRF
jgi:hypothetical protein